MIPIAITQRTYFSEHNEIYDALDECWFDFLEVCGFYPIIIPNHNISLQSILKNINIKGILLTGGNDSPQREIVEDHLLAHALKYRLPILGVCHGMQHIQRSFGLTLRPVEGHVISHQTIYINEHETLVNSYHELGTMETHPDLLVWAYSKDGVIKAIKHRQQNIIGIMWHPERCKPFKERDINLVRSIFLGESTCMPLY